jgi:hypothetical protein
MQRPVLVTTVAVIESIASLAMAYVLVVLIKGMDKAGDLVGYALLATGMLGLVAVPAIISCVGLWMGKAWGWWLALLADVTGLVAFLWDPIERLVWPDSDELACIIGFAMLLGLLLVPQVRRFFLIKRKKDLAPVTES